MHASRLILALSTVLAVPAVAVAQPVVPTAAWQAVDLPLLTLSAQGEMRVAPDMATVGTGVETRAPTAREAMAQNAAQMERLVTALVKAGIERKHIQTSSINLNPQYDYSSAREGQPPRFIGYQASNQLSVVVRDLAKLGPLIDAMVAAGATNISGPSFGVVDDRALLRQAREKALDDAKERAQFYATRSGYKSVRLVSISEQGGGYPVPMPMMAMRVKEDSAAATPVEPGQIATSVTLSVQYVMER